MTKQEKKECFLEAMQFRHACKLFDETKKIPQEDIDFILEVARLSPSSFGMEGWKFLVITNQELKEKLRPFCWNQPQITTCSHLVVILAAINNLKPQNGVVKKQLARRKLTQEQLDGYVQKYTSHLQPILEDDKKLFTWSARQTYIAAANMMQAAATIEIDSCPIEGFEKENVEKVLELDTKEYQVALLLPFGYRVNPQPKKLRYKKEEITTFFD